MILLSIGIAASIAALAFHMVRPRFKRLRLSVSAFIPPPPKSESKKNRITLVAPLRSLPFWIRMLLFLTALTGLFPFVSGGVETGLFESNTVRIIVDTSPSMSVADREGNRLDSANRVMQETLEFLTGVDSVDCVEIVSVGNKIALHRKGSAENLTGSKIPSSFADDGAGVQILLNSIQAELQNSCESAPVQAVVITDQPPKVVDEGVFGGRLLWYQVGEPVENRAVSSSRIIGGGLLGTAKLRINVSMSGEDSTDMNLELTGPGGSSQLTLYQDSEAGNNWYAETVSPAKGAYQAAVSPGGALSIDDKLHFEVPEIEKVLVDWRIEGYPRPAMLTNSPDEADIIVSELETLGNLQNSAFVATYDTQWQTDGKISTFQHQHALLNDINFDVLESNSPEGISELPQGFIPIITGADQSIWVAVREDNRAVLVPSLTSGRTEDQEALATTLFFNALDWVSNSQQNRIVDSHWKTGRGSKSTKIIAEFDTNRELSDPPALSDLALPVEEFEADANGSRQFDFLEFWLLAAILLLLLDRIFGLIWRPAN